MSILPPTLFRKLIPASAWVCCAVMAVAFLGCTPETSPSFEQGRQIFHNVCLPCHGREGGGVLYQETALNGSAFVTGNPDQVIATILFGKEGEGSMPGWDRNLTDQEVAAVASYIRQAWSNQAEPVTPGMVAKVRAPTKKNATGPAPK
jgi:mono/diheme cytochrome c family protein